MRPSTLLCLRRLAFGSQASCRACLRRTIASSPRRSQALEPARGPAEPTPPTPPPNAAQQQEDKRVLRPLGRPIGFADPPQPGENSGIDDRTLRQRWEDFKDPDKHKERREEIVKEFSKSGWQDFADLRHNRGKTFLANSRIWKREASLYFPNLVGRTLSSDKPKSTTPNFKGKVSVVSVVTGLWSAAHIQSWVSEQAHPELRRAVEASDGKAQLAYINLQDRAANRWLVELFLYRLRREIPAQYHDQYFIVANALSEKFRGQFGWANKAAGYVYLVDSKCRIRWAGSGESTEEEKQYMVSGLQKILAEPTKQQ